MAKRIILLLDGTWNDAERGRADTNIVRLRERIAQYLSQDSVHSDIVTPTAATQTQSTQIMRGGATGDMENVVLYERGVGTGGFFDSMKGGAFGLGLSNSVKRAYTFLAQMWDPGDEIYIFGFSRGSYTARSLVGFLGAVGLARRNRLDARALSLLWTQYRTHPADRLPTRSSEVLGLCEGTDAFRVKCLGVFDTVGALGVPVSAFWRENRDLFGFHDVGLSHICERSLHAVAIDEHREPFEATLWRRQKFTPHDPSAEQVWFTGSHSDVGGGYIDESSRTMPDLDDYSLGWMLQRVQEIAGSAFPVAAGPTFTDDTIDTGPPARLHESRRRVFRTSPPVWRSIGNVPVPVSGFPFERNVCFDRHATATGEAIHISAVRRLGRDVTIDGAKSSYAPRNLITALLQETPIRVVGWDSNTLDESNRKKLIADSLVRVFPDGIPVQ